MKNSLEIIRQACITANPIILELKFGCEVELEEEYEYECGIFDKNFIFLSEIGGGRIADTDDCFDYTLWLSSKYGQVFSLNEKPDWKIIGRKIGIADVLLALNEKYDEYITYSCSNSGNFSKDTFFEGQDLNGYVEKYTQQPTKYFWDLLNDDINLQSKSTQDFIAGLLGEEK